MYREGWSWCTVREGGVELVYSWRGGGAGVQLERGVEMVCPELWRGWAL